MTIEIRRLQNALASRDLVLAAGGDVDEICRVMAERCRTLLPDADGALIAVRERRGLVCRAVSGSVPFAVGQRILHNHALSELDLSPSLGLSGLVSTGDAANGRGAADAGDIQAAMTAPLLRPEGLIGVICILSQRPGVFGAGDLVIAEILASELAEALGAAIGKAAKRARLESQAHFRAITESLPQMIWTMRANGWLTYGNRLARELCGPLHKRMMDEIIDILVEPTHRDRTRQTWRQCQASGAGEAIECRLKLACGEIRWFNIHLIPVPSPGADVLEWIGVGVDIHDHKDIELALQEAVHGKDLLLYEVNHRVKNSLQLATGLLAIQASRVSDPEAYRHLMDSRVQITTIAKVHQASYRSGAHDRVEFTGFLRDLAEGLIGRNARDDIRLSIHSPPSLILPLDRAVPISLITSELVTNAVKHAMGDGEGVSIDIVLSTRDKTAILEIRDDGPGLPEDFTPQYSTGLGMEIVMGLAEQVGGHIVTMAQPRGACFRLEFPLV